MTTSEQYWFKRGYNNALAAMSKRVEDAFDGLCKENRRGRASFFTQGNPELSKALEEGTAQGLRDARDAFLEFRKRRIKELPNDV